MAVVRHGGAREFVGAVLSLTEHNGYHDSYFYATVYDAPTDSIKSVEYDSTAHAGGGWAYVDATPETLDAVERVWERLALTRIADEAETEARTPLRGKTVTLTRDYRSRKLRRTFTEGATGTVIWRGPNRYDDGATYRVGVRFEGETDAVFLAEHDVAVTNAEADLPLAAEVAAAAREHAREERARFERNYGVKYMEGREKNEAAAATVETPEPNEAPKVESTLVRLAREIAEAAESKPAEPVDARFEGFTEDERAAYWTYVSEGIGDADGYFGPLHPSTWLIHHRRARMPR